MQKKFNTIINGKGGVGKSFFAVNFVQYLKDKGVAHTAVDTDNENSTLTRFQPEALFLDIEDLIEIDSIFAMLGKTDLVVMDCRAASTDIFLDYFEEVRIFKLLKGIGRYVESDNAGESRNRQLGADSQHYRAAQSQSQLPRRQKRGVVRQVRQLRAQRHAKAAA